MKVSEIRKRYLDFFNNQGHEVIPSASLVPENDPTTLFTSSGMQPLVPYLLGERHPKGSRLVNSQKSFRAEDIEEVGDNRHTTFFEMLGNWSLGDYFKAEQLPWFFEFLTSKEVGIGLDPSRLYVSVFIGDGENGIPQDEESALIWQKLFADKDILAKVVEIGSESNGNQVGMQGGRIFYYDAKKNWWSRSGVPANMPAGEPGGPDSEVFYEFTQIEHDPKFGPHCHPNCDCGRFMEIGNSVFMEYKKLEDGTFEKLPQQNVDFGGGLERMAAAVANEPDIFKTDILDDMGQALQGSGGIGDDQSVRHRRVILDHLRAAIFLICDGVEPSNKGQGYVLRKLIRRAGLFIRDMGLPNDWLEKMISLTADSYADHYPELGHKKVQIQGTLSLELSKFNSTVRDGLREFEKILPNGITGKDAFNLMQTYGFPWELTEELAIERGIKVDRKEFEAEFQKHRNLSRTASSGTFKGGLADQSEAVIKLHTATHLLNAALRKVLGGNVWQKGSNITSERARFDFTHDKKMTDEEKSEVEKIVNEWIGEDYEVKKDILPLEEARKLGAIGVFGEKYPDTVSVYSVWDSKNNTAISREFCGGPHVERTGILGKFKIQKEEASSAGVRRIKAVLE